MFRIVRAITFFRDFPLFDQSFRRELFNANMDDHSKETAPPEEEREVEKSPSQRFIKYDTEVGRGSFKTVYKALDTVNAQPVAWLELQPHKLTKEDRSRFKVRPFRVANYK